MPPGFIGSTVPPNSGMNKDIQAPDRAIEAMARLDTLRVHRMFLTVRSVKVAFAGAVCASHIAGVVSSPSASSPILAACAVLASAGVFCAVAALGKHKKTHRFRGIDAWFAYLCLAFAYGSSVCVIAGTQNWICAAIVAGMGAGVAGIYALQMCGLVCVEETEGKDIEGGTLDYTTKRAPGLQS
jgi:hypothetical protein